MIYRWKIPAGLTGLALSLWMLESRAEGVAGGPGRSPNAIHMPREFSPDRPGSTNSATTIEPGHFQLEFELANYSESADGSHQLNYPGVIARVGIDASSEVQVGFLSGVTRTTLTAGQPDETVTGRGDLMVGYKRNFLGDDGGPLAWALGFNLKIPTNTHGVGNNGWEPTVTMPLLFGLGEDWSLSLMPELDVRQNTNGEGYHTEFNTPFTLGHPIGESIDAFVEAVTHSSNDASIPTMAYFGTGFGWRLTPDTQFDLSYERGLNDATARHTVLVGWTVRY